MKRALILIYLLCMILAPRCAQADILELDPQTFLYVNEIPASWEYIDFSEYSDVDLLTNGPLNVGGASGENVTFTASSFSAPDTEPELATLGNGSVDLGLNGLWDSTRNGYVLSPNAPSSRIRFDYEEPVYGIGALINGYQLDQDLAIAFNIGNSESSGSVPGSLFGISGVFVKDTSQPIEDNAGLWLGLYTTRASGLNYFELRSNSQFVTDDLRFTRTVVPEPASLLIFGMGMTGAALSRRRRR